MYFLILVNSVFLFVPPAASSTINKSASARSAPMSVPPSISSADKARVPVASESAIVPKDNVPEPFVLRTSPLLPSDPGNVNARLPPKEFGALSWTW